MGRAGGGKRAIRVAAGVLGVTLLSAGCAGGGDATPSDTGSATVGSVTAPPVTPSASAVPPPVLTVHDDFFPIPQADATDIPWDEVGPGWFLVDAHEHVDLDFSESMEIKAPEAIGGLSLVSPEGEWFAARSLAGTEAADSAYWGADGAWLLTNVNVNSEARIGDLVSVNLATGASTQVETDDWGYYSYASAADGVTVAGDYDPNPSGYRLYHASGTSDPHCTQRTGVFRGDLRAVVSPDGRRLVCWGERRADQRTDVGFLDVRKPSKGTFVDVFTHEFWRYENLGWLSDEVFLFARDDGYGEQEAYFSYDLSTRKVADFSLPFALPAGQRVEAYDFASQVFFVSSRGGDSVGLFRANGDPIATVAAGCSEHEYSVADWALSGEMVMVSCGWWAGGDVTLVNLATGAVVGTWPFDPGLDVRAYGYPEHAD